MVYACNMHAAHNPCRDDDFDASERSRVSDRKEQPTYGGDRRACILVYITRSSRSRLYGHYYYRLKTRLCECTVYTILWRTFYLKWNFLPHEFFAYIKTDFIYIYTTMTVDLCIRAHNYYIIIAHRSRRTSVRVIVYIYVCKIYRERTYAYLL